mmetsp:Transcript_16059/g.27085  ORF Transcript_16059/g.27085 Transcript_16059/m.27085 type:complete len:293 (-) Transcript_16059:77-955(-)
MRVSVSEHGVIAAHLGRAGDDDSLVVLGLVASHKGELLPRDNSSLSSLGRIGVVGVSSLVSLEDGEDVLVGGVVVQDSAHAVLEDDRSLQLTEYALIFEERSEHVVAPGHIAHGEAVLRRVLWSTSTLHRVAVVFKINTELIHKLSDLLSGLVVGKYHDVVVEVYELKNIGVLEVLPEGLDGGRHEDDVVVEVLVELLNVDLVGGRARDQLELESVVAGAHAPDVVEENGVCLERGPSVHEHQSLVLALLPHEQVLLLSSPLPLCSNLSSAREKGDDDGRKEEGSELKRSPA